MSDGAERGFILLEMECVPLSWRDDVASGSNLQKQTGL
jgi:hypothetical protein